MKKSLPLILVLVILLGLVPIHTFAIEKTVGFSHSDEFVYPMGSVEKLEGTIATNNNTYIIAKGYHGAVIDLQELEYNTATITRNPDADSMGYAFLQEFPVKGRVPIYAGDYTEVVWDEVMQAELEIPDDAVYLYIYYNSNDIVYLPSSVVFKNVERVEDGDDDEDAVEVIGGSSITVATWNIGHFSGGDRPSSDVPETKFEKAETEFSRYIYDRLDASLITVNEYSAMFTPSHSTKDALFDKYTEACFEGQQWRYSCNALFSGWPIQNLSAHIFECNQTATIEHTSAIKASDYYYLSGEITLGSEKVTVVTAHLAFDSSKTPDTVCLDQIDELIETFADCERVILMGDWNMRDFAYFERFVEAGYTLGNSDSTLYTYAYDSSNRSLDNIIVKGLEISDFKVHPTNLSDHYAVSATISLHNNSEDHTTHDYSSVVTSPTCTKQGYTTYICDCGDTYTGDQTSAKGHSYENGVCKVCGDNKANNCSHMCHKNNFIWKFVRFFWKLFKMNPVCDCGVKHY